ncbi:unnamed protein product [Aphanomyces euteiches]
MSHFRICSAMLKRSMSSTTRFPACPLTVAQEKQFRAQGAALLNKSIRDCEQTLADVDLHWKYVRLHQGLKVYKAKTNQAPSELMVTGIVRGSLHDLMNCMYSDDSFSFRLNSALLMPKEHLDCEVLHKIDVQTSDAPFRYNGIKWCATKWPGGTMHKPRDLCYFETTGITHARDSQGQVLEYGYSIMESIELPQCPHLDVYSIVRAKVSIRHIFRELPIGCTMVLTHCTIDPSGSLPSWMTDYSTLPQLLSVSRAAEVAESICLSRASLDKLATASISSSRSSSRLNFLSKRECALCGKEEFKLVKKRVVEAAGAGVKVTTKHFCPPCIATARIAPLPLPPPQPAADQTPTSSYYDPLARPCSLLSKPSSTTLYSDDLSEDLSELSSILEDSLPPPPPILDFDDEEADESVYSGLEFDCRSTSLSSSEITDTGSFLLTTQEDLESDTSITSNMLAQQLVQLNMTLDNTYDIMRRTRSRMNSLQSTGSK